MQTDGHRVSPHLCCGIDEAGYGPLLGPLVIAQVALHGDMKIVDAFLRTQGVQDSKKLHHAGNPAPLERLALAAIQFLTGKTPKTAFEAVQLLDPSAGQTAPWQEPLPDLLLPLWAKEIPTWPKTNEIVPLSMAGRLIEAEELNLAGAQGRNKAQLELGVVKDLLSNTLHLPCSGTTVVDRLGGRKFYHALMCEAANTLFVETLEESTQCGRYRHENQEVLFLVGADAQYAVTGLASCLAKYARELCMEAFNRWWCQAVPTLKPTAGYPEDAKRWIQDVGPARLAIWEGTLVRGS